MKKRPLPIRSIPASFCRCLEILFTDIDDTITTGGLLTTASYASLWDLHEQGIRIVVVTGRPAGWCDHIARMWPVSGVIGENGAFYYAYDRRNKKMQRRFLISEKDRLEGRKRLKRIEERILMEVPSCRISADQAFRSTDLAIDYCEDVEPLKPQELERIYKIIEEEGAVYKVSSVHINCWYGEFDKVAGVRQYLKDTMNMRLEQLQDRIVFIGDSPNDEPMFAELESSIAVANIAPYLGRLKYLPLYITENESASGFVEATATILRKRKRAPLNHTFTLP